MIPGARDLVADESGGALIEYALVLAMVSVAALTVLTGFGDVLQTYFSATSETLAQTAQQAK